MALEIERKFLIKKLPDETLLDMGAKVKEIEQAFLVPDKDFPVRRIRMVEEDGCRRYFFTLKRPTKGEFTREEIEREIGLELYLELQKERDFALNIIFKKRYVIAKNALNYEIDRFPFFRNFDVMEIELPSEDTPYEVPKEIEIIKEVTKDFRFTNYSLAKKIPIDF